MPSISGASAIERASALTWPFLVRYRYLTPDSEIKEGSQTFAVTTSLTTISIPFLEGWLLSISFQANQAAVGTWMFVQVGVSRGQFQPGATLMSGLIWEGYVSLNSTEGWPGTPGKSILDGPGVLRSITGTTPGAGAEISEQVPTNRRWSLLAFQTTLTTSGAVANRIPRFQIDDNVLTFFTVANTVLITAANLARLTLGPGLPNSSDGQLVLTLPAPQPTLLRPFCHIKTTTLNLQAADQYSAPQYLVAEWADWDAA